MANPTPNTRPSLDQALLDRARNLLDEHNWLVVHVPQEAMSYTVGLTTYGIPELVVLGDADDRLRPQVDHWAARIVAGELLVGPTITVHDPDLREHTFPMRVYDIATRGGLWLAQALYGRPRALEVVVRACRCLPCQAGLYHAVDNDPA